jgi:hypothetical protein
VDVFAAPAPFTTPSRSLPDGVFLLPVCVTRDGLQSLLDALYWYQLTFGDSSFAASFSVLEALAFVGTPAQAPCVETQCDSDDTLADELRALADGIVSNLYEGRVELVPLGAILETGARLITQTLLPLIGITLIGGAVAGLVSVLIDGILVDTVTVAAAEVIHLTIETGALATATAAKTVTLLAA